MSSEDRGPKTRERIYAVLFLGFMSLLCYCIWTPLLYGWLAFYCFLQVLTEAKAAKERAKKKAEEEKKDD